MQSPKVSEPRALQYKAGLQGDIIKTLTYADIFDYPLTLEELYRFLISDDPVPFSGVSEALSRINTNCKRIDTNENYFFLKGRNKLVELRKKREEWSKEKWIIAKNTANKLKIIPSVKMIGVTGALAMENAKENDDIDLLIITSANCLWLTRLLIVLLSPILGIKRRKRGEKQTRDKICFNLFLEENHLKIKPENLFLAHEIVQVKPILDKGGICERFMKENRWVSKYLPNTMHHNKITIKQDNNLAKKSGIAILLSCYLAFIEKTAFHLQLWYMRSRITIEKVNLHQAFFHPNNLSNKIGKEFERRIKNFEEK